MPNGRANILVPAAAFAAAWLMRFRESQPRMKPSSFCLDRR